ncbi:Mediator of RNA polymerase II transcription subunit 9-like protein, partial [Euroglyphus maynei]
LEKETQENSAAKTAGNKQTTTNTQQPLPTSEYIGKMNRLRETFEHFRQQIPNVPGSNVSKEEQLQTLGSLRQQLIMKKDLLLKYKKSSLVDNVIQTQSSTSIKQ